VRFHAVTLAEAQKFLGLYYYTISVITQRVAEERIPKVKMRHSTLGEMCLLVTTEGTLLPHAK